MRLYKLPRIKNLKVTDENFFARDSLVVTGNPMSGVYEEQQNSTIKLRIEPEMTHRVFDDFHEGMTERQPDGSFIVTVSWPEDNWLYCFILSFGKYIEVVEPKHIRNIIKDMAQEISKKYL